MLEIIFLLLVMISIVTSNLRGGILRQKGCRVCASGKGLPLYAFSFALKGQQNHIIASLGLSEISFSKKIESEVINSL